MRKLLTITSLIITVAIFGYSFNTPGSDEPISIPATPQRIGDSATGYNYLTTGDFLKSGVPYKTYMLVNGKNESNLLNRTGLNATVAHNYNVITQNGIDMVIPTCLHCHSQVFDGQLVIGMGNTRLDFSNIKHNNFDRQLKMLSIAAPRQYKAAKPFFTSFLATFPHMETEVRGVNNADKLAMILVAHRDPKTLIWSDSALIPIPAEVIPTDVPAWWLMRKKNAMFYSGFGRGDMTKFMMLSNILTVSDSSEAREVDSHFADVLAYIRSLRPPKYTRPIDAQLAEKGRVVFTENCSGCHGTYGAKETYPNLLIPASVIRTDSLLCRGVQQTKPFIEWFNKSWFVQGNNPAHLVPFNGYIAPPLDGIWATAPYLHNGSVPTLDALLNSSTRPAYWSRNFGTSAYDYEAVGWEYMRHEQPIAKQVYDTRLPGYGNHGHYFGDVLTTAERKAVIEYLKTL